MFEKFSKRSHFPKKRYGKTQFLALKLKYFGKKETNVEFGMEISSETFLVIFQHSERIQSKKRRTKCQDFS